MQCTFRSRSIGISNKCTIQRLDSFLWFSESHTREAAPVFLFPLSLFASQFYVQKKYNGTIECKNSLYFFLNKKFVYFQNYFLCFYNFLQLAITLLTLVAVWCTETHNRLFHGWVYKKQSQS